MTKKIIFLIVVLAIAAGPLAAYAAPKSIARIYQPTNIRSAASVDASVALRVQPPHDFEITSQRKDDKGKLWYEVVYSSGKKGFVASWVVQVITVNQEEKIESSVAVIDPTPSAINLKAEPDSASKTIFTVRQRAEYPLVSKMKGADGKDWYKLSLAFLGTGKVGWVPSGMVQEIKSASVNKQSVSGLSLVIDPLVNLRSSPSTKSSVVTRTTSAIKPKVLSQAKDDEGKIWYEVALPTGVQAWVRSDLVRVSRPEPEVQVENLRVSISKNVNIRADAGMEFKKVATTKTALDLPILSKKKDVNGQTWYKIKGDFGFGWVLSKVATVSSSSQFDIIESGVKLRLSPSQGGRAIFTTTKESRCTVSGSAINSDGETWYLATTDQNRTGWVFGEFVKMSGVVDLPPANLIGNQVEFQKETNLASFPKGPDGKKVFAGGKGMIDGVAQRDGGTLYYFVVSGNSSGWVPSDSTKKHIQPQPVKPIDVGQMAWTRNGEVLKFTFPVSGKPSLVSAKSYNDNPRVQLYMENAIYTAKLEPQIIDSALVSRVGIEQKSISPPKLLVTFQLNKSADFHVTPLTPTSTELEIEIFEKKQSNSMSVVIQGKPMHSNDDPMQVGNKIMIPMGSLATHLGYLVTWDSDKGEAVLQTDRVTLTFGKDKPTVHFQQGKLEGDKAVSPAPRIYGSSLYIPIEPIAQMIGFSYWYSPVENTVFLDPVIEKLEIGGCDDNVKSCSTLSTQMSFFTDYDKVELSDGRTQVTINNAVLAQGASAELDQNRVKVDFDPRTNNAKPKVTFIIAKKANEQLVFGESRNPNRLIITIKEKNISGLAGKVIILDPGHGTFNEDGTYDRGCAGASGTLESELNLRTALALGRLLSAEGASVLYTRRDERKQESPDLDGRVNYANSSGADMFISLHYNASRDPEAQGSETYYYSPLGQKLAQKIHSSIIKTTNFEDRGIRQRGFYVCRKITGIPSVLLEPLFLSNQKGEEWVSNDENLQKLIKAMADGIKSYFEEGP